MYSLVVYVPEEHLEELKKALFAAGGGDFGSYDSCSWEVAGTGQFRPLEGSQPFIGEKGRIESLREYRLEMVCRDERVRGLIDALMTAHPYEVPAYHLVRVYTGEDFGA